MIKKIVELDRKNSCSKCGKFTFEVTEDRDLARLKCVSCGEGKIWYRKTFIRYVNKLKLEKEREYKRSKGIKFANTLSKVCPKCKYYSGDTCNIFDVEVYNNEVCNEFNKKWKSNRIHFVSGGRFSPR